MDTYDLQIYQGQTFSLSLTLNDCSGIPLNLSGQAISGYLKTKYGDSGKLTDLNATVINEPSGVIAIQIAADETAKLPVNYAFYDVEMRNSYDNSVTKILAGKASIYPEITF